MLAKFKIHSDMDQVDEEAPSDTRRGSARKGRASKQNYRAIAKQNIILPKGAEISRAAIQSNVLEGLARKPKRTARDPHRVAIFIPPSFSSLTPVMDEAKTNTVENRDGHSETPNHFASRSLGAIASSESAASFVVANNLPPAFSSLVSSSPWSALGAGRVDPFANYPIQMRREEEWLIDQSKSYVKFLCENARIRK